MESREVELKDSRVVTLRFLTPEDKENILMMFSSMADDTLRWSLPPYDEKWIDRTLSMIEILIPLIAVHEDRIVGSCTIAKSRHARRKGVGDIGIFIHEDFHNIGLGTALMKCALDLARKQGLHRIWLEVVEENKSALHLYEKIGFEIEGRLRSSFLGDDDKYHDSLIMGILL
jgi:RimJ/RimL family protein N-acetyltransferase